MEYGSNNLLFSALLIIILILINAFFAASEIAIVALNRNKINHLAEEGNKKAILLKKLYSEPSKFLATIQVGITLAGFFVSASAAVTISKGLSGTLKLLNIPFLTAASDEISLIVVTILIALITLIFGELVPKSLAMQNPSKIAMYAVKPIIIVSKITSPLVKLLTLTTNFATRLVGIDISAVQEHVTEEEIRLMIDAGEENGVLNEIEKDMIDGIFEFDNTLAKEVMTPRTNVFFIEADSPIKEIIESMKNEQYSRVPVFENEVDNIIGILYMKDLFTHLASGKLDSLNIKKLLRPVYFVPETKNIDVLFRELQHSKSHMAVLIDEYGAVSGIITIEDLIEEIVGNIADEYDEETKEIQKIDDNTYIVNGLLNIDEVNDHLGIKLPTGDYDTIGGFVVNLIGSIPKENETPTAEYENITFKVEKLDERRIALIKVYIS